ncbi:MAG: phosphotransferase family protein [Solirubrobacteraceae bacterium]
MNVVATYVCAHHERLGLERLGVPRRPTCVVLTPRFPRSRHVIVLVLDADGRAPVLVGKLPRLAGDGDALDREARGLLAARRALPGADATTAPALVAFDRDLAHPLLLETALTGRPLSPAALRADRGRAVTLVAGWLARLATATAAAPGDDGWYERLVGLPLEALAARADAAGEVRAMVGRTLRCAEVLRAADLPLVLVHGDLAHPNVLRRSDGSLGVLDWERSDPAGLPGEDLAFFCAYAAAAGGGANAVRAAFAGPRPWAARALERYATGLGIDSSLLVPLVAVCAARAVANGAPAPHQALWRVALDQAGAAGRPHPSTTAASR